MLAGKNLLVFSNFLPYCSTSSFSAKIVARASAACAQQCATQVLQGEPCFTQQS
jgi:hypothetical protein